MRLCTPRVGDVGKEEGFGKDAWLGEAELGANRDPGVVSAFVLGRCATSCVPQRPIELRRRGSVLAKDAAGYSSSIYAFAMQVGSTGSVCNANFFGGSTDMVMC